MWDVDKMKIRWTNQAEEAQTEFFFEKGTATPENFRRLGKKRGGDCRIAVKREGFSEEEWVQMLCNGVCSLYDGAYQFSRSGVKMLGKQNVYENRTYTKTGMYCVITGTPVIRLYWKAQRRR